VALIQYLLSLTVARHATLPAHDGLAAFNTIFTARCTTDYSAKRRIVVCLSVTLLDQENIVGNRGN